MVATEEIEASAEVSDTEVLLEQMLSAKKAPEPGNFMSDRVIHGGDEDLPAPIVADDMKTAGHIFVYDTQTGERSTIHRNMLEIQLMKRRSDGSRVFTTKKPNIQPVRGTFLCMLHPSQPDRAKYDRMGFKSCPKSNLITEFDVEQHMKARHKKEWASIQAARAKDERDEDRAFQRQMMKTLSAAAASNKRERKAKAS